MKKTKFEMLKEIAVNTFDEAERGKYFAFRCKDFLKLEKVKSLYEEYKTGTKAPEYFQLEIIGYTPTKRRVYLNNLKKKK